MKSRLLKNAQYIALAAALALTASACEKNEPQVIARQEQVRDTNAHYQQDLITERELKKALKKQRRNTKRLNMGYTFERKKDQTSPLEELWGF